ncbi:GUN4 domain-containing protein [Mastigocoleus sp. MO_188.B34]|uniref:caspase, EACC1-associated type n=1 Tax=Mastigocoleus sp. MO_188.B34 TaxID=3036635 RepID=UPI00262EE240|nr:GUN4 domain-containing protein [Mastigocoleus sp. MO_188.B34]MDJ0695550.1 GUN4 domain-containing protein [Mastigocoleus sp. MO_188.B34]
MAKIAVLIGVSEYKYGLNPLPAAIKDVEAMQRVLQNPKMGGFTPDNITVLKNPQRQVMEEGIEMLFSSCQKDDLLLLYFSGHGIKDDHGRLFLTTPLTRKDRKGKLIRTTTVAASFIHEIMENCRSKRQIIILDSCFSGAFAEGMRAKDDGVVDIKTQLGGEGRAILTSSTAFEYSFEQQGSDLSVYTRYIVEGIETGAADIDDDGVISVDEVHDYAKKKVHKAAPAMNPGIFAIKEGYKIKIARAPIGDPKLEYRKEVEKCIRDGKVSTVGRRILKRRQKELGLSAEQTQQIENEVLEPLRIKQQNLKEYEETFREAVEQEGNLSELTQKELKRFQELLRLRDEDIAAIHKLVNTTQSVDDGWEEKIPSPSKTQEIYQTSILEKNQTDDPNTQTEPDDLSSETGVDYTKLQDLLASGKWEEADNETCLVMLRALGRRAEKGNLLKREELLNFPYTDLHTIDNLWVKHSKGRFGFSVQKDIYLSLGAKPDSKYYEEAWKKFAEQVGWTVMGRCGIIPKVFFDVLSPTGHLPLLVFVNFEGAYLVSALLSRISKCKLNKL